MQTTCPEALRNSEINLQEVAIFAENREYVASTLIVLDVPIELDDQTNFCSELGIPINGWLELNQDQLDWFLNILNTHTGIDLTDPNVALGFSNWTRTGGSMLTTLAVGSWLNKIFTGRVDPSYVFAPCGENATTAIGELANQKFNLFRENCPEGINIIPTIHNGSTSPILFVIHNGESRTMILYPGCKRLGIQTPENIRDALQENTGAHFVDLRDMKEPEMAKGILGTALGVGDSLMTVLGLGADGIPELPQVQDSLNDLFHGGKPLAIVGNVEEVRSLC